MYKRTKVLQTKNIWEWTNTKKYIILHHTWIIGEWNIKVLLWQTNRMVSCHFYIPQDWSAYKLAWPDQITFHAWVSRRWDIQWMNWHSLWIEIEWPSFTDRQFVRLCDLVKYLRTTFNIPLENILKHSDITQSDERTSKKLLRDGKSKARKTDLSPEFRNTRWYANFTEFRQKCL